jgi:hypothetical protein
VVQAWPDHSFPFAVGAQQISSSPCARQREACQRMP